MASAGNWGHDADKRGSGHRKAWARAGECATYAAIEGFEKVQVVIRVPGN